MSRTQSQAKRHSDSATAPEEVAVVFLEISHALLADTVRMVNDNQDFPYGEANRFVAGASYVLNQKVIPADDYNGYYYNCTTAGTSAGAEPTWPTTLGATVSYGTAVFTCAGKQYAAGAFDVLRPSEVEKQLPTAQIAVDNVSAEIGRAIENAKGARGATVRMMEALRSQPTVLETDLTLGLTGIKLTARRVSGQLSYANLLDKPAVRLTHTPKVSPGLH